MKIAIPTANGKLCPHFGHCQVFAIVDVDDEKKEILKTEMLTPPPHEPGVLPRWLHEQGCNIIIAGGMGHRAIGMFDQNGIEVVIGAAPLTPEEIVTAYIRDKLELGDNMCDGTGNGGQCGSHGNA